MPVLPTNKDLFSKLDVVATIFMKNRVATGKTEPWGLRKCTGDESPWDYAGGVSPEGPGTAHCQLSSEEVSHGAGNQNAGTRVGLTGFPGKVTLESPRHFLLEGEGGRTYAWHWLILCFLFPFHCPWTFTVIWSVSQIFWLLMSWEELRGKVHGHPWGKAEKGYDFCPQATAVVAATGTSWE